MRRIGFVFSRRAFLSVAGAGLIRAQDARFSTDVKVVNVLATVRDKGGKIVSNLTKDDFDLTEDGQQQTIKYFSRETDLPLTLGLLVDTSMSQRLVLGEEIAASYRFLQKMLREDKDQAFLIHFDFEVELLQDLTSSRTKLEKALEQIGLPQQDWPWRRGGGVRAGGTALYDSVLLASNDLMKPLQGRKALVLLTDGDDNGSRVALSEAIEAAQRSDSLVYSIYFTSQEAQPYIGFGGSGTSRRGGGRFPQTIERHDGKRVLQTFSEETGGGYFAVSRKTPIDVIYERIQEELRSQYSLGYTPTGTGTGFRKIGLTVKPKNMVVQTRDGYYPGRT